MTNGKKVDAPRLPLPKLQIEFASALRAFRRSCLQDALLETVRGIPVSSLDRQLSEYVPAHDLAALARNGLRGELVFAVPLILESNPRLIAYYRLLMGYSQKEFYERGRGLGRFKSMEASGRIKGSAKDDIPLLCSALCSAASSLLAGLEPQKVSRGLLDNLTLLTLGPQLRGGSNNRRGADGITQVFEVIHRIVAHAALEVSTTYIKIRSATGRLFLIEFASDPDIVIQEEMDRGCYRRVLAVEVKSGTDTSNIHNRLGEAEKSHQKARLDGFTEFWTVVNVSRLDRDKARKESPTTNRFYSLSSLLDETGEEYDDFRLRILSLTAISSTTASAPGESS